MARASKYRQPKRNVRQRVGAAAGHVLDHATNFLTMPAALPPQLIDPIVEGAFGEKGMAYLHALRGVRQVRNNVKAYYNHKRPKQVLWKREGENALRRQIYDHYKPTSFRGGEWGHGAPPGPWDDMDFTPPTNYEPSNMSTARGHYEPDWQQEYAAAYTPPPSARTASMRSAPAADPPRTRAPFIPVNKWYASAEEEAAERAAADVDDTEDILNWMAAGGHQQKQYRPLRPPSPRKNNLAKPDGSKWKRSERIGWFLEPLSRKRRATRHGVAGHVDRLWTRKRKAAPLPNVRANGPNTARIIEIGLGNVM